MLALLPFVPGALVGAVLRTVLAVVLLVRVDDTADQPVPYDILGRQPGEVDVVEAFQDVLHLAQADFVPSGRSTWVTSPVITIFDSKPRRVRNIFICSGLVFWASSRMMKASLSVRPRMYASGATSMVPAAMSRGIESGSSMSCSASYSGRRYGSIFS